MTRWPILINLAILYLVWGSTYLAIRVMVRTIPPLLGTGARFLIAGALLYGWCALRQRRLPTVARAELGGAAACGTLILAVAFGLLGLAEKTVPSGLAALVIASVPLWTVLLRLIHRQRIRVPALIGLGLGFVGVAALLLPAASGPIAVSGLLILVGAAVAEALGVFYTDRLPGPADPLLASSLQMLTAGVLLLPVGVLTGEPVVLAQWSGKPLVGLLYLIGPGSIIAYVSLVWLLARVPSSLATTYAYVNPVVALLLGAVVLNEPVGLTSVIGGALVILAVVLVLRAERDEDSDTPTDTEPRHPANRSTQ